jgi:hypothetical protein
MLLNLCIADILPGKNIVDACASYFSTSITQLQPFLVNGLWRNDQRVGGMAAW